MNFSDDEMRVLKMFRDEGGMVRLSRHGSFVVTKTKAAHHMPVTTLKLVTIGCLEGAGRDVLRLTQEGLKALGDSV